MLPYHIERARKKWQRQARVTSAIALLGLSACSADAATSFFTWDDEEKTALHVKVEALDGVSKDNADALAKALRKQTAGHKLDGAEVSAVLGASRKPDGLYVVTIVDLKDKSGLRINRIMDEKLIQSDTAPDGKSFSIPADELQRVAKLAAREFKSAPVALAAAKPRTNEQAQDRQDDAALTTASIARNASQAPAPKVLDPQVPDFSMAEFQINMGPTPGDGNMALTQALHDALKENAKAMGLRGQYQIEGKMQTGSAANGRAAVSIEWLVSTQDGRKLGAITQKNNLSPERIAGRWNEVAKNAGKAAAQGVLTLLDADKPRS